MAIYHFSVKTISRSDGRSAVAAAAYRAAEKLECEHYGKIQDYTKKSGVELTQIYAPENTHPDLLDREKLWNSVEKSENRKDALLAREFEIAFPQELDQQQRQAMLSELCQDLVKRHGVIVDAAIHAPHTEGGSDDRNYHAHIMFTTRAIDAETGFLSSKKYRDFSRDKGTKTVCEWREHFAELTNNHLALAGHDVRVDHRSYKDQGLELEATQHEGPEVTQLRRQGIETEISLKNDLIKQRNAETLQLPELIKGLEQEIVATEKLKSRLEADLLEMEKREKIEAENRAAAEKARLEAERLEAEQLDRDVSRFYEVQQRYADFTYTMLDLHSEKESKINKILKTREKIENFVAKCPPNDSIIRKEETAYELKKGYVPDFYISKESARSQINKIEKDYENELQFLAKENEFLKTASELKVLHQSLTSKGIELEIPREKKILGFTITATPPSAETLDVDLKIYYFEPLGYDFESAYNRAIRSDAQKKKDAEKDHQRQRELAAQEQIRQQQHELEATELAARLKDLEQLNRDCGYRPDFMYDALSQQVRNISSLIISEINRGRDISGYLAEKIELFERELKANYSKEYEEKVYGQIFEILAADKKLLKDDSKNLNKINSLYDKLTNHVAEKKEIEQLKLARESKNLEPTPIKHNAKNFDADSSNDFSP